VAEVSTAASPAHYGHHVWQDEDGETYFLAGHVPHRRAIAAANRYARVECGLTDLWDGTAGLSDTTVRHVWWKPDPNSIADEHADNYMLPASADEPGAEPFTEVYL
jgi:hypothetical protein